MTNLNPLSLLHSPQKPPRLQATQSLPGLSQLSSIHKTLSIASILTSLLYNAKIDPLFILLNPRLTPMSPSLLIPSPLSINKHIRLLSIVLWSVLLILTFEQMHY